MSLKNETVNVKEWKFDANGLIPVVAQDYESGEVLILAYMNEEAVNKTFETGYAHYYSRSKKAVTKYGETLGNTQKLMVAFLDRDSDTLHWLSQWRQDTHFLAQGCYCAETRPI